jgi:hypothetical protein
MLKNLEKISHTNHIQVKDKLPMAPEWNQYLKFLQENKENKAIWINYKKIK